VEGTSLAGLAPHLKGPKALAFTAGDGIALAKVLREFVKGHETLSFRQAYLDGQILETEDAQKVADMPSKDELVARLLYLLQSPMRRLAVALNDPIRKLASAVNQIAEQKE
jgi:large subunit ribosomal protein L10